MKTIVVEKNNGKAIVVDHKGKFHKIKDSKDLFVGKEVEKGMVWKVNKKLIAMGVTLAMVITLGSTGYYAYATPVDFVTLDINPSVELGVNTFGKVIDVTSFNDDGTSLTEKLDLKGDTVDEALKDLVTEAKDQGYLKEDDTNAVMVTVTTKDEDDSAAMEKLAEEAINTELEKDNLTNTEVTVEKVTKERQEEAKMLGISPGKVLLIQKLKEFNSEIKMEDYANKSVKEIMKQVNAERAKERLEKKEAKEAKKDESKGAEASNKEGKESDKTSEGAKSESVPTNSGNKEDGKNNNGQQNKEVKQENKETKQENKEVKQEDKEVKQEDKEVKQENKGNSNGNANNSNKGSQGVEKENKGKGK